MSTLNKAQLLASFPDNNIGQIVPFNMRDFVDSVELKYNNFTVVKPGQPLGNAFPDPVGGKIILPAGSVWLINGAVTVNFPIHFEDGAVVLGLTQSLTTDSLILDASAGAVALINSGDNGTGTGKVGQVSNLVLDAFSGTGRLFNVKSPGVFTVSGCVLSSQALGAIDSTDGNSEIYFLDCINFLSGAGLQFTGVNGGRLVFRGMRSGFGNTGVQFEIIGNFTSILLGSCYNEAAAAMFSAVEGSAPVGVIFGNGAKTGSPFISGVTATSINWTFSGNSGIANTSPVGALAIRSNATITDITAVNLWVIVAGTSVLASSSSRFDRPSGSTLRYIGKDAFNGVCDVSVSLSNPAILTANTYEISLFKNGVLFSDGGVNYVGSAIIGASSKQTISFSAPIAAVLNDTFAVVLRSTNGTQDPVATDLTFAIK